MVDNSNYIAIGFKETVLKNFPQKSDELIESFDKRLKNLLRENENAPEEKMRHLKAQILPGIAAYETLQTVMNKGEAFLQVHEYVQKHSRKAREKIEKLLKIPGLYRLVPAIFAIGMKKMFNEPAGFSSKDYKERGGVWRVDMLKCPYYDTCKKYGCAELCRCFCDSDDTSYDNLHKKLLWHRTKTLGRGDECCDFCLKIKKK